jgi:Uma2 family endonuclease
MDIHQFILAAANKPHLTALIRLPREPTRLTTWAHALPYSAEEGHIMGMPAAIPITTIEALLALPDDGLRHELLDGEHVVTPAPALFHQLILRELYGLLETALEKHADLELFWSPADVRLSPQTLVQPDLFIVRSDPDARPATWMDIGTPLMAIELLSPSTAARDRGKKRRIYLEAGIEEYWIVDLDARLIERWRTGDLRPEMLADELTWELSTGARGTIDLLELFKHLDR